MLNIPECQMVLMIVARQLVRGTTEKVSEFQVGSEPTTSLMPVRFSDH